MTPRPSPSEIVAAFAVSVSALAVFLAVPCALVVALAAIFGKV